MNVGDSHYRCAKCGDTKPKTPEFFYFARSAGRVGQVTGWCRPCMRAWRGAYWATASAYQKERHRTVAREAFRRKRGTKPENYRGVYRLDREAS